MNYKHLFYFWKVAKHGGVIRASEAIHISPQTLSGQIKLLEEHLGTPLFAHRGRSLELTEAGKVALDYAEEMFTLGAELDQVIRQFPDGCPLEFRVGVSDAIPKLLVYRLLRPAIQLENKVKLICREWRLDRLLAALASHKLDVVISDNPHHPVLDIKTYRHKLGESSVTFLAHPGLIRPELPTFPNSLEQIPLLIPSEDSAMRGTIDRWFRKMALKVNIAGVFDDTALMAAFARERMGAFPVPSILADEFVQGGDLVILGHADSAKVEYFAMSMQRKFKHPCVTAIAAKAIESLGSADTGHID